jgi:hypothetical protein
MSTNKELLTTIREAVSFANRKLPKSYSCIHNALSALDQLEAQQRDIGKLVEAGNEMYDELRANDAGNGSSEKGRMDMYRAWDAAKSAAPAQQEVPSLDLIRDWFDVAYGEKAERLHMGYANPVVQGLFTAFLAGINRVTLGDTGGSDLKHYAAPAQQQPSITADTLKKHEPKSGVYITLQKHGYEIDFVDHKMMLDFYMKHRDDFFKASECRDYSHGINTKQVTQRIIDLVRMADEQQPKRLTDDEIERILDEDDAEAERNGENDPRTYKDNEVYEMYMERASSYMDGKRDGLRYARDNGYLGGLTVDEVMEEVEPFIEDGINQIHDHSSDHGFQYDIGSPNWERTMNDLRARLTAKLRGK